jgi:hypothetical protein
MTPKLYKQVCCICYEALQLDMAQRSGFLDRICAGDALLRREVEAMLAYEVREKSFLATPALVIVANQAAEVLRVENGTLLFGDRRSAFSPCRVSISGVELILSGLKQLSLRLRSDTSVTPWKRAGTLVVTRAPSHSRHSTMPSSARATKYASTSAVPSLVLFMSSMKGQRRPMDYQTSTYSFPTRRQTTVRRRSESDRWCRSPHPARIRIKIGSSSTRKRESRIWLVWSERAVPELEAIKGWVNPKDHGAVRDPKQRASLSHYLTALSAIKPEVERDEVSKQTKLKGKGETLVWVVKLEHR